MFAAGRGLRGISHITGVKPKRRTSVPKKKSKLTLKQRLYVPCMWSSCLSCWSGLVMMFGGLAMSFLGFYAEYFATSLRSADSQNYTVTDTEQHIHVDLSLQYHIKNFMYLGPLVMGVGTLLAIIACVMILETRDKVLDMMELKQWKTYTGKATFYELIVLEMKRKHMGEASAIAKYHFDSTGNVEDERGRLNPC